MHVKKWISEANAARGERGGSLVYSVADEAVETVQEDGETVMENVSETEDTVNPSVTELTVSMTQK